MQGNLKEILERFKLPLALSFLGLVLIIGGFFTSSSNKQKVYPQESLVKGSKIISVDVSGAVKRAGVYKLEEGARIEEAIALAGGFAETANKEYISKYLNMAQKLSDGTKVYVPFEGEGASGTVGQAGAAVAGAQSKVNINTSSQKELEGLPGIGAVTASKIISSRPYQTIEDLINNKAVSKAVFEKIKDLVVVY